MNVSLTRELEKYIAAKVQEGKYQTASEVVREALRLMAEREELRSAELERLRREVDLGLKDIEEGRFGAVDMKKIKAEARRQHARRMKNVG